MNKLKTQKGITLVVLIITIVVLLILAVVTIGAVQDSNIIAHAQNAATSYENEQKKENALLAGYLSEIEANLPGYSNNVEGEIVENPYSSDSWTYAWVCNDETWDNTKYENTEANIEIIESADIVAKFYAQSVEIKPSNFTSQTLGVDMEFESDISYHVVVEGKGNMGDVVIGVDVANAKAWHAMSYSAIVEYKTTGKVSKGATIIPYVTKIYICNGIESIGEGTFVGDTGLEEVKIGNTVTNIKNQVFAFCDNLKSITIPGSVTSVGEDVVNECDGLENITILEGNLSVIKYHAFSSCKALKTVTIPRSVKIIEDYAFEDDSRITDVYYKGTEEEWNKMSIGNNQYITNATIHYEQ